MSKLKDKRESVKRPSVSDKSLYENLMRKFSENHKEECKSMTVDIPKVVRRVKEFPTGSQYDGTWDVLGMSGVGTYTFPNGVIYQGGFDDGMFHGEGDLIYPSGEILSANFDHGTVVERTLMFDDGLEYTENDWMYCQMPDRRYTIEYEKGLKPVDLCNVTPEQPPRDIPPGYYDTGDGFYDPITKVIYKVDDLSAIIRSPSAHEQRWIIENCRTAPTEQTGPRTDLYEDWIEPEIEAVEPPLPAAVSRACMYMFAEPDSEESLHTDSEDVVHHWQDALDDSDETPWRHLKFQPSREIQHITKLFKNTDYEEETEEKGERITKIKI
ncbi:MORN repeat-containing protein 5-like [Plodia interpunctella]|uniref:MORN repeat-containing protein 5-like n=1 Tax=Plodia interpunctella TaxID=58824 RepID=UPI0023678C51|nr:MORN repeat-containing protein 5-like [Plodia interpunctella]XP_053604930.1 MORN repeat-containing protein 5-like [Plodia interpunctella]